MEWWEGDEVSWDAVVRDYGPDRDDSTEQWDAQLDGRDIGWIQCYPAEASEEETAAWFPLGVDEHAAGIDYLLGEPVERGQGIGSAMIRAFVEEIVFGRHPNVTQACASPHTANVPSRRALAKAGFRFLGTIDDPTGPCSPARRLRPDLVLLDIHLPDLDGFQVARQLAEGPAPPVVVLVSSREPEEFGTRLAEADVRGFISKAELSGGRLREVVRGEG